MLNLIFKLLFLVFTLVKISAASSGENYQSFCVDVHPGEGKAMDVQAGIFKA